MSKSLFALRLGQISLMSQIARIVFAEEPQMQFIAFDGN